MQTDKEKLKEIRAQIRFIFEDQITDENIRQYIFGKKGYSDDAIRETNSYPKYFSNIFSLAFYFVYACYRCDLDNGYGEINNLTKNNSKRIKKSLESAFVNYPVTPDLIQFVLTDIQFELAHGETSELKKMFKHLCADDTAGFSFNPYYKIIAEYNKGPTRFQYSKLELMTRFLELLNHLSFLSNFNLENDDSYNFRFISKSYARKKKVGLPQNENEKYDELEFAHLLFRDDEKYFGGIYCLFSIETGDKVGEKSYRPDITLKYLTPAGERSLIFTLPQEDDSVSTHLDGMLPDEVFLEAVGAELASDQSDLAKKNSNSIDQVHTVNYKYIKNLALAISDAISTHSSSREFLYNRFHRAYPYIFEKINEGEKLNDYLMRLDWDSIVIMLLIEASPTAVLEFAFRRNPDMFYTVGYNLYKRIYDVENLSVFAEKDETVLVPIIQNIIDTKLILGESGGFGVLKSEQSYDKLFPRAAAMFLISKLSAVQKADNEDNIIYTGNLRSNISLLQNSESKFESEKRIKYACIILGETLKHVICFYAGLFDYGKVKAVYDIETASRTMSQTENEKYQKKFERAFLDAARRQAAELPSGLTVDPASAIALSERFVEFCKSCSLSNSDILSENSKNLYTAIGKYEIINLRVFDKLIAKLRSLGNDTNKNTADTWVSVTLDILEYFKTGSFKDTPYDSNLFNAIYPFTAVFNRGKENPDGYKTVTFSLNIDIDDDSNNDLSLDVNVLSEFVYNRREVYYCLPNVIRSNYKWWIDPILISFIEFNGIFSDNGKEND